MIDNEQNQNTEQNTSNSFFRVQVDQPQVQQTTVDNPTNIEPQLSNIPYQQIIYEKPKKKGKF